MKISFLFLCMLVFFSSTGKADENNNGDSSLDYTEKYPVVIIKTNFGPIIVKLDAKRAPVTVKNFLSYIEESFYDSTIFHRVIQKFMIQRIMSVIFCKIDKES